ncbi:MAG TPA: hypothetical protein VGX68_25800 [Thermoanaerobaculia bacterium]|jgi:hypothetical protein|nr:hypothetical protein [Thermoanaerobaculia bacterium]
MARYTGTADNGDINVALKLAIQAAKEGLGSDFVTWILLVVHGANGGAVGQNDLTVEIEATVP